MATKTTTMSNETKVIEGWAWPDMVEDNCRIGYNMYASEIQGTIPATLIIGDKAMPMREVVKMLWEMLGEAERLTRAHRMVDVDDIKAIASKYGVDLTAHSA